jgi:hypothetical protein
MPRSGCIPPHGKQSVRAAIKPKSAAHGKLRPDFFGLPSRVYFSTMKAFGKLIEVSCELGSSLNPANPELIATHFAECPRVVTVKQRREGYGTGHVGLFTNWEIPSSGVRTQVGRLLSS